MVAASTVALLADLVAVGRWLDAGVADSSTGDPATLSNGATARNLRQHAIELYGRDSDQYETIKAAFGQAVTPMLGSG